MCRVQGDSLGKIKLPSEKGPKEKGLEGSSGNHEGWGGKIEGGTKEPVRPSLPPKWR